MAWTYDVTRDVLTISYGRFDEPAARSVAAGAAVVYLAKTGQPLRIELKHATTRHDIERVLDGQGGPSGEFVELAAAVTLFGVKPYALREEILSGGMPAERFGQTWRVRRDVLQVYREILEARRALDRP